MRSQIYMFKSHRALLIAAATVVLLILVLALIGPSPWVYFAAIWLIPVGLSVADLILPESCLDQSDSRRSTSGI